MRVSLFWRAATNGLDNKRGSLAMHTEFSRADTDRKNYFYPVDGRFIRDLREREDPAAVLSSLTYYSTTRCPPDAMRRGIGAISV